MRAVAFMAVLAMQMGRYSCTGPQRSSTVADSCANEAGAELGNSSNTQLSYTAQSTEVANSSKVMRVALIAVVQGCYATDNAAHPAHMAPAMLLCHCVPVSNTVTGAVTTEKECSKHHCVWQCQGCHRAKPLA
jgi:hypothetical protein